MRRPFRLASPRAPSAQTPVRSPLPRDEVGFTVCRTPTGRLVRGPVTSGTPTSVDIVVECPPGSEPFALVHTHPGGINTPSAMDVKSGQRFRMSAMCIADDRRCGASQSPSPEDAGADGRLTFPVVQRKLRD